MRTHQPMNNQVVMGTGSFMECVHMQVPRQTLID